MTMTNEMAAQLARELRDVRTNFSMMAEILKNGAVRKTFDTPPMGMRFGGYYQQQRYIMYHLQRNTRTYSGKAWHSVLQTKFKLHGSIHKCMDIARPADWHQLLLEWPHTSETDPNRIAYTRDERAGEGNRQTVTTLGKYITRHFPTLASHQIRDITALYASDQCRQVHTTAEMIYHLGRGPKSCMVWGDMDIATHPYACYDPRLGWSMAIREEGGDTVARALVYRDGDSAYFVRSYTKNDSFSHSDTILEAWLNSQGIKKRGSAEGAKLAKISRGTDAWGNHSYVFPYIDGGIQCVEILTDYMVIDSSGEFLCNNTDGTADDNERRACEDCGERENEDDGYWTGYNEDHWVCNSCHDDYYWAYGRNGRQYYLHSDNVVHVSGTPYDPEYLGDNNIVELHDGDYSDLDNAVYIESVDAYYDCDDEAICHDRDGVYQLVDDCVQLENSEWCLTSEAWQCEHSNDWYANDDVDGVVTACGLTIHPDYADEYEMPEGYEEPVKPEPTPAPEIVAEVAVEPVPFPLSGGQTLTNASPLRGSVVYDVDGLRVTRYAYVSMDLVNYQATKRVYERELCVAYNAGRLELSIGGAERRIVANLCEQIANMEVSLHQQHFQTEISQRYAEHLRAAMQHTAPAVEQAMQDVVLYGTGMVQMGGTGSAVNISLPTSYWGPSLTEMIRNTATETTGE